MDNYIFNDYPDDNAIQEYESKLSDLTHQEKLKIRDDITNKLVEDDSDRMVIISGPGTGKSYLFLEKIKYIYNKNPGARILIITFVRKLANELKSKIEADEELKYSIVNINSLTLHATAFDILKKTKKYSKRTNTIDGDILDEVWNDILKIENINHEKYGVKYYSKMVHDDTYAREMENDETWKKLISTYNEALEMYNAFHFDDHIQYAYEEVYKNPGLVGNYETLIVDEYQDFNLIENKLIGLLSQKSRYSLFVGDDDQVLYDELKHSHCDYIRELVKDKSYKKAFLPFCGRCSSKIVEVAGQFTKSICQNDDKSIRKVFLPINNQENGEVNIIACNASSVSDYIRKFIKSNDNEFRGIEQKLKQNENVDPFAFIISPNCKNNFISKFKGLNDLIEGYQTIAPNKTTVTFKSLSAYYELSDDISNNLNFRKLMMYEDIKEPHLIIKKALADKCRISELDHDDVKAIIEHANSIREIYDSDLSTEDKIKKILGLDFIRKIHENCKDNLDLCKNELRNFKLKDEHRTEEKLNAIELMNYPKCKGLSAEHVFIIGFDDKNMIKIKDKAFYVALTRARKSIHIITSPKVTGARTFNDLLKYLPTTSLVYKKYTKNGGIQTFNSFDQFQNYLKQLSKYQNSKK